MGDKATVWRVGPGERTEGAPTSGMAREQAVSTDRMWAGFVTTDAGMVSGWHHHGEYETSIHVISGTLRMEFGAGGTEVLEASAGDFVYVAPPRRPSRGQPRRPQVHPCRGARRTGRAGDQRRRSRPRMTAGATYRCSPSHDQRGKAKPCGIVAS